MAHTSTGSWSCTTCSSALGHRWAWYGRWPSRPGREASTRTGPRPKGLAADQAPLSGEGEVTRSSGESSGNVTLMCLGTVRGGDYRRGPGFGNRSQSMTDPSRSVVKSTDRTFRFLPKTQHGGSWLKARKRASSTPPAGGCW
jgi:hypothetical protein